VPFEDATIDTIFASHLLEHLIGVDVLRLLREVERARRRGVIIPNL
jgi:predicted SAM-dependent methyltransferase